MANSPGLLGSLAFTPCISTQSCADGAALRLARQCVSKREAADESGPGIYFSPTRQKGERPPKNKRVNRNAVPTITFLRS